MLEAQVMHLPADANRHHHSHYQVVVGLAGEADIDVDGKGGHLDASRACVLPGDVAHDFRGNAHNHVLVINIDEHSPVLCEPQRPEYELLNRFFDRPRQLFLDNTLRALVQACSAELKRRSGNQSVQHYLATGIVQCMGSALLDICPARVQWAAKPLDMARIDRYVEANLHRSIAVEDLASCVCMSRSHFHDRFRQTQGLTPHQYLLRARLERARVLIEETGLPLWDISHRAGFSSQSALTNAMRKHLGLTPSGLRRQAFGDGNS